MKTITIKNTALTFGFLSLTLCSMNYSQAQTNLEYPGGPKSTITQQEIDSLRGWSQNAQHDITRLLDSTAAMSDSGDIRRKLFNGMESIVRNSEPKASDLLLRHAIYGGLTISRLIEQETIRRGPENTPQGTVDQQVRILRKALNMSIDYYKSDYAYINGILSRNDSSYANPKLVEYGVRFSTFMIKMSDGVMDASSSYAMIRWSLGVLGNYMSQDSRNVAYASTIRYLNDELRQYPDLVQGQVAPDDVTCVKYIRELKRIGQEVFKEIQRTSKDISVESLTIRN